MKKAELEARNAELEAANAELTQTLKTEHRRHRKRKAASETKGRRRSRRHNAKVAADREERETKRAQWLKAFQERVDSGMRSRPHLDSCSDENIGWTSSDLIHVLKTNKDFREKYSAIWMPPPPLEELCGAWVISIDSAMLAQKEGKPGPIMAMIKLLDQRLQPQRAGRPTKTNGAGADTLAPADDEQAVDDMYASLLGG